MYYVGYYNKGIFVIVYKTESLQWALAFKKRKPELIIKKISKRG